MMDIANFDFNNSPLIRIDRPKGDDAQNKSKNGEGLRPLADHSVSVITQSPVHVHFRDLESHLIQYIKMYPVVVGCVAWLTSKPILDALATRKGVSIVVQKEDFLRPDIGSKSWPKYYRSLYSKLPSALLRCDFHHTILPSMGLSGYWEELDGIRCVGNHNADKSPAFPRSHHKFVVFCSTRPAPDRSECPDDDRRDVIEPCAVWTGSFNFTANGTKSLENALFIPDSRIAMAYLKEWAQITAISEPLNWSSEYVAPEWRVGT